MRTYLNHSNSYSLKIFPITPYYSKILMLTSLQLHCFHRPGGEGVPTFFRGSAEHHYQQIVLPKMIKTFGDPEKTAEAWRTVKVPQAEEMHALVT
jgi:hypothetical protein